MDGCVQCSCNLYICACRGSPRGKEIAGLPGTVKAELMTYLLDCHFTLIITFCFHESELCFKSYGIPGGSVSEDNTYIHTYPYIYRAREAYNRLRGYSTYISNKKQFVSM